MLFILLCTVAILHCILRRQQRQYVQSSPRSLIILHISHSVHEKINHDNTVPSIQVSKSTSFPKESGCPFRSSHPTPSSLEKASDEKTSDDNNISKRMIPSVYLTSHYSKHCYRTHHCSTSAFLYPGRAVAQRLIFAFTSYSMDF